MPLTLRQRTGRPRVTAAIRTGIVVVVAVGVLTALHLVVVARAEARIAQAVGEAVGTTVQADVGGFAAGLLILLDRIPSLTLTAVDVPAGDPVPTTIADLEVVVTGLVLQDGRPVAGDGGFVAQLTEAQVREAAPADLAPLLRLVEDDLRVGVGLLSVPLELQAGGDSLLVSVPPGTPVLDAALGQGVPVPLGVPAGVVVTGATVAGGRLVLMGTLDPVVVAADV